MQLSQHIIAIFNLNNLVAEGNRVLKGVEVGLQPLIKH
jgi:hypothetical protein